MNRAGFAVLPRLALQGPGPKGASRRIAILGGGITGLATAYTLARARESGAPIEEVLIEGSDRLGGAILTERVEGFLVEAGPDSFLAEKPEAASLCRELGLGDSLIGSNDRDRRTYILHRGRLVPLARPNSPLARGHDASAPAGEQGGSRG